MDIELVLYKGPKYNKRYKLLTQIDIRKIKRKRQNKEQNQLNLQNIFFYENIKRINNLKLEKERIRRNILQESER